MCVCVFLFSTRVKSVQGTLVRFFELSEAEQAAILKKRLKEYSKKTYKKQHQVLEEEREATICMRYRWAQYCVSSRNFFLVNFLLVFGKDLMCHAAKTRSISTLCAPFATVATSTRSALQLWQLREDSRQ
jgi:hypothetical protein